ncbi:hypothetical protein DVH05_017775 [Phytophthora capsici]|nr:hypothetical protein DVH05_017775 [Phytophthora capsici]
MGKGQRVKALSTGHSVDTNTTISYEDERTDVRYGMETTTEMEWNVAKECT